MMSDGNPIHLTSSGPPETRLPLPSIEFRHALSQALSGGGEVEVRDKSAAIAAVVALHPRESAGWAALGDHVTDTVSRYAFYRVGYHRGLDALRANGWRGSGYVRWDHEGNRGFLRCLLGLTRLAGAIGEADEEERCRLFLLQLDPRGVPDSL
jgi:hypothetical protein